MLLASLLLAAGVGLLPTAAQAQTSRGRTGAAVQGRHISDQEHAWMRRQEGQNQSFQQLLESAEQAGRGRYLGVEPDISRNVYRFKFQRSNGSIVWVDVDGRTGRQLAVRE